ncbi:MAG: histidinol-phosphate transaminase [Clostridia bacterium]|nr:histidinol-phosphate transaminase [Clostridia bacterium]
MFIDKLANAPYVKAAENFTERPRTPDTRIGVSIARLDSNESPYGTAPSALGAMIEAAAQVNTYPAPYAEELRDELAEFHNVKAENVLVANGSCTVLEYIADTFIAPGDEIISCVPTFGVYKDITEGRGGKFVSLPLTSDKRFDLDAIRNAVNENTKMIIICNPNNPTGTALKSDDLEKFLLELPESVICVVDEAYIDFAEEKRVRSMLPLIYDSNVIIVRTFSKIYGLAAQRIGYAVADEEIMKYLRARQMVFNVSKVSQAAARAALKDREFYNFVRDENKKNRDFLKNELKSLRFKVYHSEANFIYMNLPENVDGIKLRDYLRENNLYVVMDEHTARITIGTGNQCERVVKAVKEFMGLRK